jgi:hypothetical protein
MTGLLAEALRLLPGDLSSQTTLASHRLVDFVRQRATICTSRVPTSVLGRNEARIDVAPQLQEASIAHEVHQTHSDEMGSLTVQFGRARAFAWFVDHHQQQGGLGGTLGTSQRGQIEGGLPMSEALVIFRIFDVRAPLASQYG